MLLVRHLGHWVEYDGGPCIARCEKLLCAEGAQPTSTTLSTNDLVDGDASPHHTDEVVLQNLPPANRDRTEAVRLVGPIG